MLIYVTMTMYMHLQWTHKFQVQMFHRGQCKYKYCFHILHLELRTKLYNHPTCTILAF